MKHLNLCGYALCLFSKPLFFTLSLILLGLATTTYAQIPRTFGARRFQLDDGANHYSLINGSSTGGSYTLADGGGTILTNGGGSGTQNFLTKWNNAAGTTLGNSILSDNGTTVTVAGILNMNSHQINNVTNPTNPQDAATKAYVDAAGGGSFTPAYLYAWQFSNEAVAGGGVVSFNNTDASSGITLAGGNTITVTAAGVYEVDYMVHPNSATSFILSNGGSGPTGSIVDCAANVSTTGTYLFNLSAGGTFQLTSFNATTLTSGFNSASIKVIRIK